jgi:hypothetical protein
MLPDYLQQGLKTGRKLFRILNVNQNIGVVQNFHIIDSAPLMNLSMSFR